MATNQYDIAQQNISRRRGLVDALTQASLTPSKGQMVGQVYVGPGLLDALSKPLMALAGNYAGGNLDKEELSNSDARRSALVDALTGMQNQPGTSGYTNEALGSPFEEVQKAGLMNLQAQLSPKNIETYGAPVAAGPNGELTQFSNRGHSLPSGQVAYQKPEAKTQIITNPDGTLGLAAVDPNTGTASPIAGVTPYVRPPAQTNINNNMPKQEGSFGKTLGQKDAERYDQANTILANEANQADMISRLKALESQPVLRGGLADLGVKVSQIGATLGVPVPESVSNAEQANAVIQQAVVDFIKQGGRGITDEEGQRMVKTWPNLLLSPTGAKQVREQMESINTRNIRQARTTQKVLQQRYPDAFPQPQSSGPKQGDVMDGYRFNGGDAADPKSWSPI